MKLFSENPGSRYLRAKEFFGTNEWESKRGSGQKTLSHPPGSSVGSSPGFVGRGGGSHPRTGLKGWVGRGKGRPRTRRGGADLRRSSGRAALIPCPPPAASRSRHWGPGLKSVRGPGPRAGTHSRLVQTRAPSRTHARHPPTPRPAPRHPPALRHTPTPRPTSGTHPRPGPDRPVPRPTTFRRST